MIQNTFQSLGGAIANYNFTDIATGTGTSRYYLGRASGSAVISPNVFYSYPIETISNTSGSVNWIVIQSFNFDIDLKLPRTLRGDCIANIPMEMTKDSGGLYETKTFLNIYKFDGVNSTIIASGSTAILSSSGAGATSVQGQMPVYISVPQTPMKRGEKIRLNIQQLLQTQGAATGTVTIGHDPKNRTGTRISSQDTNMLVDLSFKIDLS